MIILKYVMQPINLNLHNIHYILRTENMTINKDVSYVFHSERI